MYDRAEVNEFLKTQGKDVAEMAAAFASLRWGVKEIKCFLQGVVRDPTAKDELYSEELKDEVAEAATVLGGRSSILEDMKKKGIFVIKMSIRLAEVDKVYLRSLFSSYGYLDFVDRKYADYNPHPILRSAKNAMESLLFRALPSGRVLEVGPNIASAVRRGVVPETYRGLVPILDSLDAERVQSAMDSVRMFAYGPHSDSYKATQKKAAQDALKGVNSVMFRRQTFQQNTWKADAVFGGDSFYDISLRDAVLGLHKCAGKVLFGTLVNVPSLSDLADGRPAEVRGVVGQTEQCWYLNQEEDYICFYFKNSSTRPYKHKLSQLLEYFRQPYREFEVEGVRYLFRRSSYTNDVFFVFSIERIGYMLKDIEDPKPTYKFVGGLGDVEIRTSAVDLRYAKGDSRRVVPVTVTVGEDSFSRVLSDRLVRGPGKVEQVMNFARTNRVNIVHNGVRVSCERPVAIDQLRWFSVAIDALAIQLESTAEKDLKYVKAHVSTGGWCTPAQVAITDPGLARSLWTRMIMGMAEALPVSVVRANCVEKYHSTIEKLEPLSSVGEECFRADEKDAEVLLIEERMCLDAAEVEALEAWLKFSKTRKCCCSGCFEEESSESEESECEFFDVSSGIGESSTSTGFSESSASSSAGSEFVDALIPDVVGYGRELVVRGEARSAVEEYVEILKGQIRAKEDEAALNAERLVKSGGIVSQNLAILDSEKVRHYGVRVGRMGILEGTIGDAPPLGEIVRLYDPARKLFMSVRRDGEGRGWVDVNAAAVCYSNDDFLVWINPYIISTMEKVLERSSFGALPERIPFVNGIWGSGKSFLAKEWFRNRAQQGFKPMFLGASRKPTEEVREDLFGDSKEGKRWVRTMGSFLSWGFEEKPDVLVMDEVCMEHAAIVYAVLELVKPLEFWVCGDFKQMPYVPFLAGCRPKFSSLLSAADLVLLNKGHRVTEDVYAAGLSVYGENSGLHSCDCEEHVRPIEGMKVVHIDSIAQVPAEDDVMYLTFGQATKENVKKYLKTKGIVEKKPGDKVATMAEFQGGTRARIAIVRDVRAAKKGSIYHEVNRVNVGGSRATQEVVYYTVSRERDFLVQFMEEGKRQGNVDRVRENKVNARVSGDVFGLAELNEFVFGKLKCQHSCVVAGRELKRAMLEETQGVCVK